MLAVCVPGQGSQFSGMFNSWILEPDFKHVLEDISKLLDLDLTEIGCKYSDLELKRTEIAQVVIVVNSILSFQLLDFSISQKNNVIYAGHSVGEVSAGYLSGVYSLESAIKMVQLRGNLMAKAAKLSSETGMSAVLGGSKELVIEHLNKLNLYAANINSDGQIVAAGYKNDLKELETNQLSGTRVRALDVAAAFHTSFMEPAKVEFEEFVKNIKVFDPVNTVLSNFDGQVVKTGHEFANKLVNQLISPVRWDLCQDSFTKLGVTGMLELAPGSTLCGIAKRQIPQVETFALKSPSDLADAKQFVSKHSR